MNSLMEQYKNTVVPILSMTAAAVMFGVCSKHCYTIVERFLGQIFYR